MKNKINITLLVIALAALIPLFYPFAEWAPFMAILLRVIPAFCIQLVFCRVISNKLLNKLPLFLVSLAFLWGTYLFFTSPDWFAATPADLILYYGSPALGCAASLIVHKLTAKNQEENAHDKIQP